MVKATICLVCGNSCKEIPGEKNPVLEKISSHCVYILPEKKKLYHSLNYQEKISQKVWEKNSYPTPPHKSNGRPLRLFFAASTLDAI